MQKDQELQVYLLKRSPNSGFMAENYVFPGGTVDLEDRDTNFWRSHVDIDLKSLSIQLGENLFRSQAPYLRALRATSIADYSWLP